MIRSAREAAEDPEQTFDQLSKYALVSCQIIP